MNERMLQRCRTWDYRARGIYMITLTTLNRRPLFGRLVGGRGNPCYLPERAWGVGSAVLGGHSFAFSRCGRERGGADDYARSLPRRALCL